MIGKSSVRVAHRSFPLAVHWSNLTFTVCMAVAPAGVLAESPTDERLTIEIQRGESPFAVDAKWQLISSGHAGCEGAQWEDCDGGPRLLYAAHHDHLAFQWTEVDGLKVWRDDSPEATSFRPDGDGGYYVVEQTTRQLARWDENGDRVEVLASHFGGKRLNRPNDCVVHSDGTVWFTDPDWLFKQRPEDTKELEGHFVFRFNQSNGSLAIVAGDFDKPNGIAFSPDENWLFVTDSGTKNLYRWPLMATGTLGKREIFATFSGKGNDGIAFDRYGRLWCCTNEGIIILNETSEIHAIVRTPNKPTSVAFAPSPSSKVCVTTRDACYITDLTPPSVSQATPLH